MTQNLDGKEARGLAQSLLSSDGGCEEGDDTIEEGCSSSDLEMEVEDDDVSSPHYNFKTDLDARDFARVGRVCDLFRGPKLGKLVERWWPI